MNTSSTKKRTQETIQVFNIPKDILESLSPAEKETEELLDIQKEEQDHDQINAKALERLQIQEEMLSTENSLGCNTCKTVSEDRQEQVRHFNTDWHRYNIKRKVVLKVEPVTLEEFETIVADLTESISGSESEDEQDDDAELDQEQSTRQQPDYVSSLIEKQRFVQEEKESLSNQSKQIVAPVMKKYTALKWFKTQEKDSSHYGVYRHLFTDPSVTLQSLQLNQQQKKRTCTIIMLGGGHFAACVIDINNSKNDVKFIVHKTLHRYTTRRKQGGSQSTNDNAKGVANSAGAQIRRYNEQSLTIEVRQCLDQWRKHIHNSDLILTHAPSGNRKIIYNYENAVLDPSKHNIKSVPFATKRPTLSELKRIYTELTTIKVMQFDEAAIESYKQKWIEREERAKQLLEKSTVNNKKKAIVDENPIDLELEKLLTLVKQNKTVVTLAYLDKHMNLPISGVLPVDQLENREDLYHYPTLLHMVAAMDGASTLVKELLYNYNVDPTIVSDAGKTAYEVCKDKESRNAFRRCMNDKPDLWLWLEEARVPSPLTEKAEADLMLKEEKKLAKELEKKRLLKLERQKIEAETEAKEEEAKLAKVQLQRAKRGLLPISTAIGGSDSMTNTANMTPEARMRLEREKRARAAEERINKLSRQNSEK